MIGFTNSDDIIDSSDIAERIEELESEILPWRAKLCDFAGIDKEELFPDHSEALDALAEWLEDHAETCTDAAAKAACEGLAIDVRALAEGATFEGGVGPTALVATIEAVEVDSDAAAELATLRKVAEDVEGYAGDGMRGTTLIRESYFADYAEELIKDIGALPEEVPSYIVIDWEATANNIRVDYTETDFDGVTYLFR